MAEPSWQQTLLQQTDAAAKEWMALQRRYHLQLVSEDADSKARHVRLFLSLSDPDLPARLKGEVELQMTLPERYPIDPPRVDFAQWSSRLSDAQVAALNCAVYAQAEVLRGGFALRKLLTWIDNNFVRVLNTVASSSCESVTEGPQMGAVASAAAVAEDVAGVAAAETLAAAQETATADTNADMEKKRNRRRKPCRFFARGICRDGDKCKFSHNKKSKSAEKPVKADGDATSTEQPSTASETGVDVSQQEKQHKHKQQASSTSMSATEAVPKASKKKKKRVRFCKFFAQGQCRSGDKCKFSHERKADKQAQAPEADLAPRSVVVQLGTPVQAVEPPAQTSQEEKKGISIEAASTKSHTEGLKDSSEWTEAQQHALDLALKTFPATMDKKERWTSIADAVEGRSLGECIDRFKLLCELVRRGVDLSAPDVATPTDETDTEVSEDKEQAQNQRIIPSKQRIPIETEPEARGTQISLEDLFLHEVGTLVPHRLVCQIQCDNCPLKFDAVLTLNDSQIQKWCPRCSVLHHVSLRPVFAHSQSNVLAYVDTDNCSVVDVLPSDVLATCLDCGCEALLERLIPRQRAEQACFSCHVKLAVMLKRYVAGQLSTTASKVSKPSGQELPSSKNSKKGPKQVVETFTVGQPLPNKGICEHYKHSYRWFRFQCCGKTFPCDVCHDSSDCPEANMGKFASRMICGLCSKEQSSAVKVCACGNDVASKKGKSRHWEGGTGCRDVKMMSRWDKQKYRGMNKTESKKFKRVGAEAKARREQAAGE